MGSKIHSLKSVPPGRQWKLRFPLVRANPTTAAEEPVLRSYLTGTFGWAVHKKDAVTGAYPATPTTSGTFVINDVLQDSYKTGDTWDQGEPGFNFEATMPAASFASANTEYLIEISYTFTGGDSYEDWFHIKTLNVPV